MVKWRGDERIGENVLRWIDHIERMWNDRIAEWVYVGECMGSCLVDRLWKRRIYFVDDYLKKKV